MKINVYHKGFLLYSATSELEAWEKARKYAMWFSGIEVKGVKP